MTRHTRRSTRLATLAALTLVGLALTACAGTGAAADATAGTEVTTIRYQGSAGAVNPLELADALGYLDGLTLEKIGDVTGGPQGLQALASKQTDISSSAFFGAIAQLVGTGAPIKAVVPTYGSNGKTFGSVIATKQSGITDARGLIGKRIAVNTLGANAEAVLDAWFDKEKLTQAEQDQITLVPLPPLNTPQALKEGQVDAAYLSSVAAEVTKQTVDTVELTTDIDVVGKYSGGAFSMRDDFIAANPNTTKTLVAGVAKAVNFIETHTKQEIFDVYFPYLDKHGLGDYKQAIEQNFPGTLGVPSATPVIRDKDIAIWLDWLQSRGDVDAHAIKPSDVYTNEFNPYAKR
ncbi:MAG TPA: ABC transporter substrate-binding protein [Pseudolysinimonas sp.]|nr:ABC transporter substrate-binding protein [Pseudolysinimonas sp.]